MVAGSDGFFADEQDGKSHVETIDAQAPAYRATTVWSDKKLRMVKEVVTDPNRSALLVRVSVTFAGVPPKNAALYAYLNPYLSNCGNDNEGWLEDFKGTPMLMARHQATAAAFASSPNWDMRTVGFVGVSDGLDDLHRRGALQTCCERVGPGNIALLGGVAVHEELTFTFALGFGHQSGYAAHCARAALMQGFDTARRAYVAGWKAWTRELVEEPERSLYGASASVIRTHEDKRIPGGIVASLAVPWGPWRGEGQLGYRFVWCRDLVQSIGALIACRRHDDARRVLFYLLVTQEPQGRWPQNMWLDGSAHWKGTQLDEIASVFLLVDLLRSEGAIDDDDVLRRWPQLRRSANFLLQHGPVTPMDRWEEGPGYFASTFAVAIPALLIAAELADMADESDDARKFREAADRWEVMIDPLLYVVGSDLAHEVGVRGYYARFARSDQPTKGPAALGKTALANHPKDQRFRTAHIVSPDALTLVRYGMRAADDPRIRDTVKVIDHLLKVELPGGLSWKRYLYDGYGEHEDGSPFDGRGIGRAWPLLTGERAHYEIAAGRIAEAERLLQAMESFANESGFLPEQTWDQDDIPEKHLFRGRPTGSATPLVWAHAEYMKLCRSLRDRRVFDMPRQACNRYVKAA